MSSVAGSWVRTSTDALSPRGVRHAAYEFGFRERGVEHTPEVGAETLRALEEDYSTGWTRKHKIANCAPPVRSREPFDREARWTELQGKRFEQFLAASGPVIWRDSAGAGKSTNAALGVAERDLQHALAFATHEKAREHLLDGTTPDGYVHLKGRGQPLHDCCLDANIAGDDDQKAVCPDHGNEDDWPRMCPLSDLEEGHPQRERFKALAAIDGTQDAHNEFCGNCPWAQQFEAIAETERVVGVHEHQQLLDAKGFMIIVDETPRLHGSEEKWNAVDLRRAGTHLRSLDIEHAETLGEFVRTDLYGAVGDGTLDGLTPPSIGSDNVAEKLARLKIAYNETLQEQIEMNEWDGTPPCFDAIIAALAETGYPTSACREAIAAPSTLANCPRPSCGAATTSRDGRRICMACHWEDGRFDILPHEERDRTRALAYLETSDAPNVSENGLCFLSLPDPSDLPDTPLILDATATPAKVAAFYGVSVDEVRVEGDDAFELRANTTQIQDGGYHPGTIEAEFDDDRRRLDTRIQRAIDVIAGRHNKPLFISKRSLLYRFDFPDHAERHHYGGLRGLNLQECDAVICIGAPHPNVRNLEHQARLLAMDRPDIEVGGEEHGTRDGAPNPPIYRKLYYSDEVGRGRAVPTKHYTGLVGELFYEAREKELEQAIHRIRPLLAEESKEIYLLTNVPTELPVDEFVELDAISDDPLRAHLPVPHDVFPHLLEPLDDLGANEDYNGVVRTEETITATREGLHALATDAGAEWSESTAWRRVRDLVDLGIFEKGAYEQNEGYRYTVDRAALSRVLLVTSSTGEKPGSVSRFRRRTRAAEGSLDWLRWAEDEILSA